METIPKADCQRIGFFRKTHGIHGELILDFEPQFEYSVEEATRFFVELDGLLVPFFLNEEGLRFRTANTAIVSLKWVENEKYAKRLIGNSVYLFLDEIAKEEADLMESKFTNYLLEDVTRGKIGLIIHEDDFSGNIVLTVDYDGEEILVPFNENLLVLIDENKKVIRMNLPEGLLDT